MGRNASTGNTEQRTWTLVVSVFTCGVERLSCQTFVGDFVEVGRMAGGGAGSPRPDSCDGQGERELDL